MAMIRLALSTFKFGSVATLFLCRLFMFYDCYIFQCVCNNTHRCSYIEHRRRDYSIKKAYYESSIKKKEELGDRDKEKEHYFECYVTRNQKLTREKGILNNKFSVLKEQTLELKKQLNVMNQSIKSKNLSLQQQTVQLNQVRAEYSILTQQFVLIYDRKIMVENGTAEKENASASVQKGASISPSTSRQASVQCSSTSTNSSDILGLSSESNAVNIQSSRSLPSVSNVIVPSENHNTAKQASPQSNEIQCDVCMRMFSKASALACHKRVHKKRKRTSHGNERETNEDGYDMSRQDGEISHQHEFKCPECSKICLNACGLANHRRSHSNSNHQDGFRCPECSKICLNACGLANHRRSHSKEQQKNAGLDEASNLNEATPQSSSQANDFQCLDCFKICQSASGLTRHRRSHSREMQKSALNESVNQDSHRTLPLENKFQCPECFRICLNACGLANHRRIHSKEQNRFVSEGSDQENKEPQQRQVDNGRLVNQQDNRKTAGKLLKKYKCKEPQCNKIFYFPAQLRDHENTHTGRKPYTCEICFKSFSYRASAYTHSLTHSSFRAHKCSKCNFSFTQLAHLRRHMLVHQGNTLRSHKCHQCGASFVSAKYLKSHISKIHAQQPAHASESEVIAF